MTDTTLLKKNEEMSARVATLEAENTRVVATSTRVALVTLNMAALGTVRPRTFTVLK